GPTTFSSAAQKQDSGQFCGSAKTRTTPSFFYPKACISEWHLSFSEQHLNYFPNLLHSFLMDPASAIIGFTAGLTTLVGLVIESAKTLYKAQSRFKEAPRDIRRFSRQIYEFEALLRQVQLQINVECGSQTSAIQALINTSAQHMQDDLKEFD